MRRVEPLNVAETIHGGGYEPRIAGTRVKGWFDAALRISRRAVDLSLLVNEVMFLRPLTGYLGLWHRGGSTEIIHGRAG